MRGLAPLAVAAAGFLWREVAVLSGAEDELVPQVCVCVLVWVCVFYVLMMVCVSITSMTRVFRLVHRCRTASGCRCT